MKRKVLKNCLLFVCARVYVLVRLRTSVRVERQVNVGVVSTLLFKTGSLNEPGAH